MTTLKECPFCGEKEVTITQGIKGINAHYVIVCSFCGAGNIL
ncbi:Lar family restriction alleviation protein [uncultured Veillonella sp.]